VEQEEGEEEKEEKNGLDLLDGEFFFVSASKDFPFLCKIHCCDYS